MPHKAKFRPIQLQDGSAWYVLYSPDKGPTEHIDGFYTEEDALEWIELESTSWLAKKETRYVKLGGASVPRHPYPRKTRSTNIHAHAHPVRRAPHAYGRCPARAKRSQGSRISASAERLALDGAPHAHATLRPRA